MVHIPRSELTHDATLLLALAAAEAALAKYFHPDARSAEEALNAIGSILDHKDVVSALQRKIQVECKKEEAFQRRLDRDAAEEPRSPGPGATDVV